MAIKAQFTRDPLQVVHTEDVRKRIKAIADREDISQSQVVRELIDAGLEAREERSVRQGSIRV